MSKITIEDIKVAAELLRKDGPGEYKPPFIFTQNQIDLFIEQGEIVDQQKMTVNRWPYVLGGWPINTQDQA